MQYLGSKVSINIGKIGRDYDFLSPIAGPAPKDPKDEIPAKFSVCEYESANIRELKFEGDLYDTLLVKSNMGTGKTKALIE